MQAVILAGGLGTRLRSVVSDLPKAMAPIGGRPFLEYLLENLLKQDVDDVTLAVGHMRDAIIQHFGDRWQGLSIRYSIETEPLGTGGALRRALRAMPPMPTFVLNGDTWLPINFVGMHAQHVEIGAAVTVAVCPVLDVARYGAVQVEGGLITGFYEKGLSGPGMINGGIYLVDPSVFNAVILPEAFSFESDFLVTHAATLKLSAFVTGEEFIDIGVPNDYARAQIEIQRKNKAIDRPA